MEGAGLAENSLNPAPFYIINSNFAH